MAGYANVTLYDTLGGDSSEFIMKQAELSTVVCTVDHIKDLLAIKNKGNVPDFRNILTMNEFNESQVKECSDAGVDLHYLYDLITKGESSHTQLHDPDRDDLFTICYTSGTTGTPKGVMLTHRNMIAEMAAAYKSDASIGENDVHLSYLPLAHIMERLIFCGLMTFGGRIGFYQGDVLKLKDDLMELRPTVFASVPRLYSKLYDRIQSGLAEAKGLKKKLAMKAINTKLANLHSTGSYKHCLYDALVFKKMKAALGGRVRMCITGSAPISKEVIDFLKIAFCCPIYEGYGQTETTGGSCVTKADDKESGHVGGVVACTLIKIVDVPEMKYFSTDTKNDVVYPRGEICFKGDSIFAGYFKEPEKTAEALDNDGWLHTGDIAEMQPNGSLRIIDRKKNIFKLSQGEYIAAEKLELLFAKHPYIAQMFVYGDSLQSYLIAIIVVDQDEVVKGEGINKKDINSHIKTKDFEKKIQTWFQEIKKEEKLTSLEIPQRIL